MTDDEAQLAARAEYLWKKIDTYKAQAKAARAEGRSAEHFESVIIHARHQLRRVRSRQAELGFLPPLTPRGGYGEREKMNAESRAT